MGKYRCNIDYKLHGICDSPTKSRAVLSQEATLYRPKDRKTLLLFPELFPLGGGLNAENRWLKLSKLVPWDRLENVYRRYFSEGMGRPAKDSRLICGLLIVKHAERYADERVIQEYLENPYVQAFCGEENFRTVGGINPSLLSKMRKRLGAEFFKQLEREILGELKKSDLIKPGEHLLDATVFPSDITFPTDAGLLNKCRQWTVKVIRTIETRFNIKEKARTYCRKAQKAYLGFQKKRRKTKREIRLMQGKLLRFLKRNVGQVERLVGQYAGEIQAREREFLRLRLETVKRIYAQQEEMWRTKVRRVKERIVSLHMPHIRPIVRGKAGRDVEFGAKALLSWVDGFCFMDRLGFDAYNEGEYLKDSLDSYKERFGRYPKSSTGDGIFGNRANREQLKEIGVRGGFKALGRGAAVKENRVWYRERQKKRASRMEGIIGCAKNRFGLDRVKYRIAGGEEICIRLGLLAMNLNTALRKQEAKTAA